MTQVKKSNSSRAFRFLGVLLFFGLLLFLTFNRHSKTGYFNYHSEIWGDKAGYYVYAPAFFKYDFSANQFPDSIDQKTGNGFLLDLKNDKVQNKYTYGVALMQTPFYLLADLFAKPLGYKNDGFSPIYHWAINISAVFYFLFGLYFLWRFLRSYYSRRAVILTLSSLFLATNLYYYAIDETGMSHIYSFALFAFALFLVKSISEKQRKTWGLIFILGFVVGLILVIRPTNIIFVLTLLLLDLKSSEQFKSRFSLIIKPINALPFVLASVVAVLPQLFYWHYATGNFFNYSYGEEGFNWFNPELLYVWFSTNNGLLTYTPFFLLIVISIGITIRDKVQNAWLFLFTFMLCSYVFASWWVWFFGCSFGARSFVEYYALFSLPLAYFFQKSSEFKLALSFGLYSFVVICIVLNFLMTYHYDGCYYGEGFWDWNWYFKLIWR